jgi:hypothetical protein
MAVDVNVMSCDDVFVLTCLLCRSGVCEIECRIYSCQQSKSTFGMADDLRVVGRSRDDQVR